MLADKILLLNKPEKAVANLWIRFYDELNKLNLGKCIIYSHNLGSFDGYFIFKGLFNIPNIDINKLNSIVNDEHQFIGIEAMVNDNKYIWKDSLRLFPLSLTELYKMFNVQGKTLVKYNPLFNNIDLFNNPQLLREFTAYSIQDSVALLNALTTAQKTYLDSYNIDFTSVWSTSTLSLKIFRQQFLNVDIPILPQYLDKEIRNGYIGGSTDYYLHSGIKLYKYDINSLYPKAMLNPMPLEFIRILEGEQLQNVKLEDIFGFFKVRVTAPTNILIPLLPYKHNDMTIHPVGTWIGTYFSEELKAVQKYGYKIELIKLHEFTKTYLFNEYVEHFYKIKQNSSGSTRFIAKMHLNQLYGYFGRKLNLIETKNIYIKDLKNFITKHTVSSIIKINEDILTILISSNLDYDLINSLNIEMDLNLTSSFKKVKSNVGIAAAVTAYARMEMIKYKTIPGINVFYTDTDSIFTDKPLPLHMIGDDLGLMKDELNGQTIIKAYFLGIKKYGYLIKDKLNNKDVVHSVFSGIERDSLTWDEIEHIAKGGIITKNVESRFYKKFDNLEISSKNSQVSIAFNSYNLLNGNYYNPPIIKPSFTSNFNYYEQLTIARIRYLINKFLDIYSSAPATRHN